MSVREHVRAQEREVVITGKEIVERLIRLEEGQRRLEERIQEVEARLGQRMDETNRRIDETNRRIDELREFLLWGFGVTFAGIFALVGFVIWDRRTALAPAVRRIEELQERARRLELALREYAAKEPELAEALKKAGLM
ncbi:MAG: hemolysin XhlA family protein [Blastocatellia bacterium]|nr:hemolysin XhlA family protein [Blastocatellia bacterium]